MAELSFRQSDSFDADLYDADDLGTGIDTIRVRLVLMGGDGINIYEDEEGVEYVPTPNAKGVMKKA